MKFNIIAALLAVLMVIFQLYFLQHRSVTRSEVAHPGNGRGYDISNDSLGGQNRWKVEDPGRIVRQDNQYELSLSGLGLHTPVDLR